MKTKPWTKASDTAMRDVALRVSEPDRPTEFEVQAFLWHGLRELGINARGEVKTTFSGRACVRFDIAIFENGVLVGIIEIKSSPVNHKTTWDDSSVWLMRLLGVCGVSKQGCLPKVREGNAVLQTPHRHCDSVTDQVNKRAALLVGTINDSSKDGVPYCWVRC